MSDAYGGEGDTEVRVTMLNINYDKNQKLMDACESFKEYAWLVESVRRHQREKMDLDAAVDAALDGMPDTFMIKEFVLGNRSEVKSMFLTEYNEEKIMEKEHQEGVKEGVKKGKNQERERVAVDLLKEGGMSVSFISRISKLSEESVRNLAKTLGIAVF